MKTAISQVEAARILDVAPRTVLELERLGKLKGIRSGGRVLYRTTAVRALAEERAASAELDDDEPTEDPRVALESERAERQRLEALLLEQQRQAAERARVEQEARRRHAEDAERQARRRSEEAVLAERRALLDSTTGLLNDLGGLSAARRSRALESLGPLIAELEHELDD